MYSISASELEKVLYLDVRNLDGRRINLMPFWDGEQWHLWIPADNKLIHMHPIDAAKTAYVAKAPVKPGDIYIPFLDLMWQRASYSGVCRYIEAIYDDFHNMSISISKIRHFFETQDKIRSGNVSGFVATELEYILIMTRTIFDLLHEMIACFWKSYTQLTDSEADLKRRNKSLPKTFTKMVLQGQEEHPRSAEQIVETFGIPLELAEEYVKHTPFFVALRQSRDRIVHGGNSVDHIFATERGFCVSPTSQPFAEFYISRNNESDYYNQSIVSLLPWLSHIIFGTIEACNSLAYRFASVVLFPPEIAPGYKIFIRDSSSNALLELLEVARGGMPWWNKEAG